MATGEACTVRSKGSMTQARPWGRRQGACPCGIGGRIQAECCLPWEEAYQRLTARMVAFAALPSLRPMEREAESLFRSMDGESSAGAGGRPESRLRFLEWFLCDYVASRGRGPLLGALADGAVDLPDREALLLLALLLAPVRAYEVSETIGPQGVMLKDLLVGSERRAGPAGLPPGLIRSDVVIGRFFWVGRLWRPGPSLLRLAAPARGELLAYARTAYQMARPGRHVSVVDFLDGGPHLYHHFFRLRGEDLGGQEVTTVRSVAYAPARVRLDGSDAAHIRVVLERQPDLELVAGGGQTRYAWIPAGDGVARATVTLDERGVEVLADTRPDLTEASAVLARALQGLVREGGVEADAPNSPTLAGKRAAEPEGADFLRRMVAGWAGMALPLLADRSPVEACRSQAGRLEVVTLLAELARDLARARRLGRAWADLDAVRGGLGLTELEEPGTFTGGADRGKGRAAVRSTAAGKPVRRGGGEHRPHRSRR